MNVARIHRFPFGRMLTLWACALALLLPATLRAGESDSAMSKVAPILVNLYHSVTVSNNAVADSTVVDPEFYRDFIKFDLRDGVYWLPLQVSVAKEAISEAQEAVQRLTDSSVHSYGSVLYGEFPISKLPELNSVPSVLKITGIESGGSLGSSVFLSIRSSDEAATLDTQTDVKKKAH